VTITPLDLRRHPLRDLEGIDESGPERLALAPGALPAGQQYRFTFNMGSCIGCHSCEVACAEQNGLPVEVSWRRVGEIEGGSHPDTRRFHLSLACNHCLEPACMTGCPTKAYTKLDNGIVAHDADACIGCQYCTWNCPYSVPVFQPDRRIVTKCDMCSPRLEAGFTSACVDACPTHAIGIETVDVDAWRLDHHEADAPHLPSSEITLSTTRIILPKNVPADTFAPTDHHVAPEHAHWSLIFLTLLTQLSVGAMGVSVATRSAGHSSQGGALVAAASGVVALAASMFHLGRPIMAWKALRGLRTSWLSREVFAFGVYAPLAIATAFVPALGWWAVTVGVLAVLTSARLYLVPGRPAWNHRLTLVDFVVTAAALGPAVPLLTLRSTGTMFHTTLSFAIGAIALHVVVAAANLTRLWCSGDAQERGTVRLAIHRFSGLTITRGGAALAAVGCGVVAWTTKENVIALALMAIFVVVSVTIGRYLFYVTVVPLSMPGNFFQGSRGRR
jgi:formate dehydrogenase iron-sulfur subunit